MSRTGDLTDRPQCTYPLPYFEYQKPDNPGPQN